MCDHIPDPGKHRTLFYGTYVNRTRGAKGSREPNPAASPPTPSAAPQVDKVVVAGPVGIRPHDIQSDTLRGGRSWGALTLEVLEWRAPWGIEISLLGDAVPSRIHPASVVARWALKSAGSPDATGLALMVLRRRGDGWEIVQDASM
jgi:hypothetical protein